MEGSGTGAGSRAVQIITDPDPDLRGTKIYGSYGSGSESATLVLMLTFAYRSTCCLLHGRSLLCCVGRRDCRKEEKYVVGLEGEGGGTTQRLVIWSVPNAAGNKPSPGFFICSEKITMLPI
jgi:hypothetical protein